MSQPRLLFLAYELPDPPIDGGRLRTLNILRGVAAHYAVTLVAFDGPDRDPAGLARLEAVCEQVVLVGRPRPRPRTAVQKIAGLAARFPAARALFESQTMRQTLRRVRQTGPFAVAHVDHIGMAVYFDALDGLPIVLTHHNVESLKQARELRLTAAGGPLARAGGWLEQRRWRRFEIDRSRRADALAVVSEPERAFFADTAPRTPAFVVPNGVDIDAYAPLPAAGVNGAPKLLFTGKMSYAPNVDAMTWFCATAWPAIHAARPDARLLIVGRDPAPAVVALADVPGVTVTGEVPDVRPYFAQATVFVVPLRFGGGTRLKILEAAALGRPIVSTPLGAEGLDLRPEADLRLADTPEALAAAVLELIADPAARARLATSARHRVEARYAWASIVPRQLEAYARAAAGRSTTRAIT